MDNQNENVDWYMKTRNAVWDKIDGLSGLAMLLEDAVNELEDAAGREKLDDIVHDLYYAHGQIWDAFNEFLGINEADEISRDD